ncbi:hypothetical protein IX57_13055 [Paracoccus sanguinis]|uniref:DUF1287 domain-containing protein n=1 Tax=Paracoccus sanguinis TaxID=1545044 RepID=A0A099G0T6_9RHOB|nr:hypothetical protein IX54_14795 [Paracoccus sanguinis]KGJ16251.1 hypothetical protein IX57_13055 [Paracoccus sanguinis]KGJ20088.1 hypothetical protein IX56_14790 [Paracoccus sanguinis]
MILAAAALGAAVALADPLPRPGLAPAVESSAAALVGAARRQIGVTTRYDPAYAALAFPGGDVARDRGVCTDVLIRALRDAAALDLQRAVHRDMTARFADYPQTWGLRRPDRNIDHRRVPNLIALFDHLGARVSDAPQPGDIVTVLLPGNLPHVMLVSDRTRPNGQPLVIHNIGRGTREEDALDRYPRTGHFRLTGPVLDRLRGLDR